jgi:hypothetical protein
VVKIVTVSSATPTATCVGTQLGRYATTLNGLAALGGCPAGCASGPDSTSFLCGTSLGVPTYCCNRPLFSWAAVQNNTAPIGGVTAYPYISLPVTVRPLRYAGWGGGARGAHMHTHTHTGCCMALTPCVALSLLRSLLSLSVCLGLGICCQYLPDEPGHPHDPSGQRHGLLSLQLPSRPRQ